MPSYTVRYFSYLLPLPIRNFRLVYPDSDDKSRVDSVPKPIKYPFRRYRLDFMACNAYFIFMDKELTYRKHLIYNHPTSLKRFNEWEKTGMDKNVVLVDNPLAFVSETRVLPIKSKTHQRIDLIFGSLPFEKNAIDRAVKVKIGKTSVYFCTAEDLILLKIISDRQKDISFLYEFNHGSAGVVKNASSGMPFPPTTKRYQRPHR